MQEISGNIWTQHKFGRWVVVTTNGSKSAFAKKIVDYVPKLSTAKNKKNLFVFDESRIITFPIKHHWRANVSLDLVERSLKQLVYWADNPIRKYGKFYLPRVACDAGELAWSVVAPLMRKYLDDRFVVVSPVGASKQLVVDSKDYRVEGFFPPWTSPSGKVVFSKVPFSYSFHLKDQVQRFLTDYKPFAEIRTYYKGKEVSVRTLSINYKYKVRGVFAAHLSADGKTFRQEKKFTYYYLDRERVLHFLNTYKPFDKINIYDVAGRDVTSRF